MKKGEFIFIFLFLSLLSMGIVFASPISNDMHLNIQVTYTNGTIEPGVYNFVFNITNDAACNNVLYSNSVILATDSNGVISYYLPNVTLPFDQQYYLCYYRAGSLISSTELAMSPYAYRANSILLSGVSVDSNFNLLTYNFTGNYGFFNYLGSLINRISTLFVTDINASGNVNVTGTVYGIYKLVTCVPNAAVYNCACGAGYVPVGGGGYANAGQGLRASWPNGNSWQVVCITPTGTYGATWTDTTCAAAYAQCLKVG